MARVTHRLYNHPVDFELCVRNVDKPPINFHDLSTRKLAMQNAIQGQPWAGNVHLTTAPTFAEKATLFPGVTFLVGFDTFRRIADPKYYGGEEARSIAIKRIRDKGCRFLVFHRICDGKTSTMCDVARLFSDLTNLADVVPATECPPSAISSSEIRKTNDLR